VQLVNKLIGRKILRVVPDMWRQRSCIEAGESCVGAQLSEKVLDMTHHETTFKVIAPSAKS